MLYHTLAALLSGAICSLTMAQAIEPQPETEAQPESESAASVSQEVRYTSTDETTIFADLYLPDPEADSPDDLGSFATAPAP